MNVVQFDSFPVYLQLTVLLEYLLNLYVLLEYFNTESIIVDL